MAGSADHFVQVRTYDTSVLQLSKRGKSVGASYSAIGFCPSTLFFVLVRYAPFPLICVELAAKGGTNNRPFSSTENQTSFPVLHHFFHFISPTGASFIYRHKLLPLTLFVGASG
jgi:hypothetical protein